MALQTGSQGCMGTPKSPPPRKWGPKGKLQWCVSDRPHTPPSGPGRILCLCPPMTARPRGPRGSVQALQEQVQVAILPWGGHFPSLRIPSLSASPQMQFCSVTSVSGAVPRSGHQAWPRKKGLTRQPLSPPRSKRFRQGAAQALGPGSALPPCERPPALPGDNSVRSRPLYLEKGLPAPHPRQLCPHLLPACPGAAPDHI